jgi:hypothetical protein
MERRGFVLSVILILAVAMFAGSLNSGYSNDLSGMQGHNQAWIIPKGNINKCFTIGPSEMLNSDNLASGHDLCRRAAGRNYHCVNGILPRSLKVYNSIDSSCTRLNYEDSTYMPIECEVKPGEGTGWSSCWNNQNGRDSMKMKGETVFTCCRN